MIRNLATIAICAMALAAPAFAQDAPTGLVCPEQVGDADRIAMAPAGLESGVTGYCSYALIPADEDSETDDETTVTLTLRVGVLPVYDWKDSFTAVNIEKGEMTLVGETTENAPFGDRTVPATVIALSKDEHLGPVEKSFRTLWVFDLGNNRVVSLEEEYSNLGENRRTEVREALLKAQKG